MRRSLKVLPEIRFKVIPHEQHRYETVGDYWFDKEGILQVRVSDMGNPVYHFCVFIHELTEWFLTWLKGIKEEDIKAFDEKYEAERDHGLHRLDSEPGLSPKAPYRREHIFATVIERKIFKYYYRENTKLEWVKYGKKVMSL